MTRFTRFTKFNWFFVITTLALFLLATWEFSGAHSDFDDNAMNKGFVHIARGAGLTVVAIMWALHGLYMKHIVSEVPTALDSRETAISREYPDYFKHLELMNSWVNEMAAEGHNGLHFPFDRFNSYPPRKVQEVMMDNFRARGFKVVYVSDIRPHDGRADAPISLISW